MLNKEQREEIRRSHDALINMRRDISIHHRYNAAMEVYSYVPYLLDALEEAEELIVGATPLKTHAIRIYRDACADRDRLAARCAALERAIFKNGFKCRLCKQSEKHLCQLRVKGGKCKDGDHWEFDEARYRGPREGPLVVDTEFSDGGSPE